MNEDLVTGLDHVQVARPAGSEDALRGLRRFHTQDPVGNRIERQQQV